MYRSATIYALSEIKCWPKILTYDEAICTIKANAFNVHCIVISAMYLTKGVLDMLNFGFIVFNHDEQ